MRGHASLNNISRITKSKITCQLDDIQRTDVLKLVRYTFTYSGIQIQIITREELNTARIKHSLKGGYSAENEAENCLNDWTREKGQLETDFTKDSKSVQRTLYYLENRAIK